MFLKYYRQPSFSAICSSFLLELQYPYIHPTVFNFFHGLRQVSNKLEAMEIVIPGLHFHCN